MTERLAVVGSREGADLEYVETFLRELYKGHPDTLVVSGGATGVDSTAEQTWIALGGRVHSFRPVKVGLDYGIEFWDLGGERPTAHVLIHEPTWEDFASCAFYRNLLIVEACTRLVAFYRPGRSRGASQTEWSAESQGRPTFRFELKG